MLVLCQGRPLAAMPAQLEDLIYRLHKSSLDELLHSIMICGINERLGTKRRILAMYCLLIE